VLWSYTSQEGVASSSSSTAASDEVAYGTSSRRESGLPPWDLRRNSAFAPQADEQAPQLGGLDLKPCAHGGTKALLNAVRTLRAIGRRLRRAACFQVLLPLTEFGNAPLDSRLALGVDLAHPYGTKKALPGEGR